MTHMFFFTPRVNEDIINKDYKDQVYLLFEHFLIKSMKDGGALVSPNEITYKFIMAILSSEGCFWNVTISDLELIITRSEVYL